MYPRSKGPDMKPLSSGPDMKPLSRGPEAKPRSRGPDRGPENPLGTGCRGSAEKEEVLAKAAARSYRALENELNCSHERIERGVAVLADTDAPEIDLKEVSETFLGFWSMVIAFVFSGRIFNLSTVALLFSAQEIVFSSYEQTPVQTFTKTQTRERDKRSPSTLGTGHTGGQAS